MQLRHNARSGERGSAAIVTLVIAAVGVTVALARRITTDGMVSGSADEKRLAATEHANVEALTATQRLVNYPDGGQPAIFPKPYFGTSIALGAVSTPAAGARWSQGAGLVNITTHAPRSWTVPQTGNVFAANAVPANGRNSTVALTAINFDPGNPLIIASIDVEAQSEDDRRGQEGTLKTKARIVLPPPPPPGCTLTAVPAVVNTGEQVTLTLRGRGVIVGGNLHGVAFGGSGVPPTPADSVDSNVILAQRTITVTGSVYPFSTQFFNGRVVGPAVAVNCPTASVRVIVPPCTGPCPSAYPEGFNEHFPESLLAGRWTCFDRANAWDEEGMPNGVNGRVYAAAPPTCGVFNFWRNRNEVGCFDPKTKIRMADGRETAIESLRVGEMVLDPSSGKGVRVQELIVGPELKPMLAVSVGERRVKVTALHPFLTARGLVAARDLVAGDELQAPHGGREAVTAVAELPVVAGQRAMNLRLGTASPFDSEHVVVADGIVTGDLYLQERLAGPKTKVSDAR